MILIGSDHAGYLAKENLKKYLSDINVFYEDCGTYSCESCDYPLIAEKVATKVLEDKNNKGILICGSGIGMSIASNKIKGIRAALCYNSECTELSRKHNDANILCTGARIIDFETINKIVDVFLRTPFEGGRHQKRIDEIKKLENLN